MRRELAKFSPPRIDRIVERKRIHTVLDQTKSQAVCWIAGPAGTGKTAAVATYTNATKRPILWYRVDEGDQDIATFFYFLSRHSQLKSKSGAPKIPTFSAENAQRPIQFARRFFRTWFSLLSPNTIIVFDDLHSAECAAFQEVFATALAELPRDMFCFCLSRTLPFPELSELQMKGELASIDHLVLDFTIGETIELFGSRSIPSAHAEGAHKLAQGWAAGLQLISEQIKRRAGFTQLEPQASKSLLFYYLANKVFCALPCDQQQLLIRTNLLPEVSPSLANRLLDRNDCAQQFAAIYRQQLFISRRGGNEPIYHYHDLLRGFLREQLEVQCSPAEIRSLKRKAARALAAEASIERAIELAIEGEDYGYAQSLLVQQAQVVLSVGRHQTFIAWADGLPVDLRTKDAWLCYWQGMAWLPKDDGEAEVWFEHAYTQFEKVGDSLGMVLTASGCISALLYGWRKISGIDRWIECLLNRRPYLPVFADVNQEIFVRTNLLRAAINDGNADSNLLNVTCHELLACLGDNGAQRDPNIVLLASKTLIDYAVVASSPEVFERAILLAATQLDDARLQPWTQIIWLNTFGWVSACYFSPRKSLPFTDGRDALQKAAAVATAEGGMESVLFETLYRLVIVAGMTNDVSAMEKSLVRMEGLADHRTPITQIGLALARMGVFCARGEYAKAIDIAYQVREAHEGYIAANLYGVLVMGVQPFLGAQLWDEAIDYLSVGSGRLGHQFGARVRVCAELARALSTRGTYEYVDKLENFFRVIREDGWYTVINFLPSLLREICCDALRSGVERDFCGELIRKRNIEPPSADSGHWPWSVKVHALGGFQIEVEGTPIKFGPKVPKKPLEVLKILVATPGHEIESKQLMGLVWSESTTATSKAMFMTLSRLRKLIGREDVVLFDEGTVKLNRNRVWIDAVAFEVRAADAIAQLGGSPSQTQIDEVTGGVFSSYRGALFGSESTQRWSAPARERLQKRFLQLTAALGGAYERQSQWKKALAVYERGLDQDNLAEEFYRGLIRCNLALGEGAAAMAAYRRCREMLSIVLGLPPGQETVALIKEVRALAV